MYQSLISVATGVTDPKRLRLIEDWMRQQTGGCLDHLARLEFIKLARQSDDDLQDFAVVFPIDFSRYATTFAGAA